MADTGETQALREPIAPRSDLVSNRLLGALRRREVRKVDVSGESLSTIDHPQVSAGIAFAAEDAQGP